jgi:hypothetical protein
MVEGALLLAGARTVPSEAASLAVVVESSPVEKKRRGRRWRSREGGRRWRSNEGKVAFGMGSWAPAIGLGTGASGGIGDWRMETGAGGVRKGIRVCQPRDQPHGMGVSGIACTCRTYTRLKRPLSGTNAKP